MSIEDNTEKEAGSGRAAGKPAVPGTVPEQPANDAVSSRHVIFRKFRASWFLPRRLLVFIKRRLGPMAGLICALGIIIGVVFLYKYNPGLFDRLENYGYLGVFLIGIVFNATVILPVSNIAVIISMGATMPSPLFVALAGGAGAAIGELTAYLAGRSGQGFFRKNRLYLRLEGWVRKWGWIAVFIMSVFPAVFDVAGLAAGAMRMPLWRFLIACVAGRVVSYIFIAYMADLGFSLIPWLS